MSQVLRQKALARICLDRTLRGSLARGERLALADLGLSERELDRLIEFVRANRSGLDLFTDILEAKRTAAVRACMPLTVAVAGEDVWRDAWAACRGSERAEGVMFAPDAAARIATYLLDRLECEGRGGALEAEVIAYEQGKLQVLSAPAPPPRGRSSRTGERCPVVHRPFLLKRFEHDVTHVVAAVRTGSQVPRLDPEPQLLLFYRHWGTGGIGVAKTTAAIGRLLVRCNGNTPAQIIAASLAHSDGAPGQEVLGACGRALAALEAAGVVVFTPAAGEGIGNGQPGT